MSQRIFDRNNYKKRTLDTFEILGAYFIDIYYNHLYIEAKRFRASGSVNSITEGYKVALTAFLNGVENPKHYKKTLVGIHSYFIASGMTSITFSECIERITEEFIPADYYSSVSKTQKTSILKLVITQSNRVLIEKIVRRFLDLIIDNHDEPANIRILQDEYIDILILEREGVYHRFISTQAKTPNTSTASIKMIESMQIEIKKLCNEKYELKQTVTNLKKIILKKEFELRKSIETAEELSTQLADITAPVAQIQPVVQTQSIMPIQPVSRINETVEKIELSDFMQDPAFNRELDNIRSVDVDNIGDISKQLMEIKGSIDSSHSNEFDNSGIDGIDGIDNQTNNTSTKNEKSSYVFDLSDF